MKRRDNKRIPQLPFLRLAVCATCDKFRQGISNDYCLPLVPVDCVDEYGVMDWELPESAQRDMRDTCDEWKVWK